MIEPVQLGGVRPAGETERALAAKRADLSRALNACPLREREKKPALSSGRQLALEALAEVGPRPARSDYLLLVRSIRRALAEAGLPTRVDDSVRLRVIGDSDPGHAFRCARALAEPGVGLASGATMAETPPDLEIVLEVDPVTLPRSRALDAAIKRERAQLWQSKIYSDEGTFSDLARFGAYEALQAIRFLRQQLNAAVADAVPGKITIASCSSAGSIERIATYFLELLDRVEPGSPLMKSIEARIGAEAPFDRGAKGAFKALVAEEIQRILDTDPTFVDRRRRLEAHLAREAREALHDHGVLMLVPSGNSFFGAQRIGDPELSRPLGLGDNALIVVGGMRLDPERGMVPLDAESVAPSQIVGLARPIPVGGGRSERTEVGGTSYAVPFIAAVAALAATAGRGISAAELASLLVDPRFQTAVPGRNNPGGFPDAVALCRAAAKKGGA